MVLYFFAFYALLEFAVFVAALKGIGFFATIGLFFLSAVAGGFVIRYQSALTLMQVQTNLQQKTIFADDIFNGFCTFIGGLLLIFPGFVSDIAGISLLIPFFRQNLRPFVKNILNNSQYTPKTPPRPDDVIEGTFIDISENADMGRNIPPKHLE